jgi:predicted nucleic-acid-binding Zn-ribbon protein
MTNSKGNEEKNSLFLELCRMCGYRPFKEEQISLNDINILSSSI